MTKKEEKSRSRERRRRKAKCILFYLLNSSAFSITLARSVEKPAFKPKFKVTL